MKEITFGVIHIMETLILVTYIVLFIHIKMKFPTHHFVHMIEVNI